MKELYTSKPDNLAEPLDEFDILCLGDQKHHHLHILVPYMSDEIIDTFYQGIEECFMRQGGYMRKCSVCGDPFPYFPHGIQYGYCNKDECHEEIMRQHDKCALEREADEIKRREEADKRKAEKEKKEELERLEYERVKDNDLDPGFIYLMRSENGLHKIGRAQDIKSRLSLLNREIPIKVEVVHFFKSDNYKAAEKYMHERYSAKRVKYEWFDLSKYEVADIKSIADYAIDGLLK